MKRELNVHAELYKEQLEEMKKTIKSEKIFKLIEDSVYELDLKDPELLSTRIQLTVSRCVMLMELDRKMELGGK